ncbi:hypothetical protein FE257_010094 [Aspergillus nanangensis]|uniref:Major facilitator superfamily (MFS) profile domain-containing protein n=1 Tax=Aspergillus nanangensis TaxID=2582783 RepID=A0AAD4GSF2_ASPNN|nr:hypothetical protein FE257_010094 [Aspergillus nanangensis]
MVSPTGPAIDRQSSPSSQDVLLSTSPPDGGYGWVCVIAIFFINCFTWGAVSSYGVYLENYLSDEYFPEAQPMDYAFIGGLIFAMAMLVAPLVTIISRKYSTKVPMFLGIALLAIGYVTASFAQRIWQLYLSQGVAVGVGLGFTYIPSIPIVSQWFDKKRSLANGICSAGSGIGGLIFSFMADAVIRNVSLGWALRLTAIVSCSVLLIATVVIRDRNSVIQPTQRGFDAQLLRQPQVMLLLAWAFISILGYMTLLFSLPDFARSIGLSRTQAATTNAVLNLGTAVGRPVIGIMSDRCGRIEVAGIVTLVCGLSCFAIWLPAESYGVLLLFSIISGGMLGVFWVTIGPLCAEIADLKDLQSLLSLSWLSTILPAAFSEVIGLKLRRPNSGREYLYAQIYSGLAYICASAFMFGLWIHRRRGTS